MTISWKSGRFVGLALAVVLSLGAAVFSATSADADADATKTPLTVIELYTSQGCSSCPPADTYLGELSKRDDILALSLHVDYWDYIGWKDPFANPKHTDRQRDYAVNFGMGYVYTPQMVIQGMTHATGSSQDEVEKVIQELRGATRVDVRLDRQGDGFKVTVPGAASNDDAAVWLVVFDREHETKIKRGENAGKTLAYHNVVRQMKRIGTWRGAALKLDVSNAQMAADGRDGCAVLVQSLRNGRILGAAKLDL